MCDIVRIDHFRGFDSYWRVPLPAENAKSGEWRPGPGMDFFRAIGAAFPDARIIAEDLGLLTPSVEELLADTGLPGMAVLQFAFGGDAKNPYLPHNLTRNRVIYPGTHDNDTTLGWYAHRRRARCATTSGATCASAGTRSVGTSSERPMPPSADIAVIPMQDILSLGSEARFNSPGKPAGQLALAARRRRHRRPGVKGHRRLPGGAGRAHRQGPGSRSPARIETGPFVA